MSNIARWAAPLTFLIALAASAALLAT